MLKHYLPLVVMIATSCSHEKDGKKSAEPVEPPLVSQPLQPASQPEAKPAITTNEQSKPTPEEICRERSDDYEWKDNKCQEKPNELLSGRLDLVTGIIWSPSTQNCTKTNENTETGITYFQKCAGVDVSIPIAKPSTGSATTRIRMKYTGCPSVIEFPMFVKIGEFKAFVSPLKNGEDVLQISVAVDASVDNTLIVKMVPDYNKAFGASAVSLPSTCKIELVENAIIN